MHVSNQNNYKVSGVQHFTLSIFQLNHPVDENRALTHIKYDCKKSGFYIVEMETDSFPTLKNGLTFQQTFDKCTELAEAKKSKRS